MWGGTRGIQDKGQRVTDNGYEEERREEREWERGVTNELASWPGAYFLLVVVVVAVVLVPVRHESLHFLEHTSAFEPALHMASLSSS